MGISFPQNFDLAGRLGLVEGVSEFVMAARAADIQTVQPPLTIGSNNLLQLFAAGEESWEIVSDDAADAAAGTGARSALITYLDDEFILQSAVVALNGTTPVAIAANCFRHQSTLVISAGSGQTNAGRLTIQVAGGGAARANIAPATSASRQASFTIPAGYSLLLSSTNYLVGRGSGPGVSATIAAYVYLATGVRLLGLDFTISEPGVPIDVNGGIVVNEKATLEVRVNSVSHNDVDVSVLLNGLLVNTVGLQWPVT